MIYRRKKINFRNPKPCLTKKMKSWTISKTISKKRKRNSKKRTRKSKMNLNRNKIKLIKQMTNLSKRTTNLNILKVWSNNLKVSFWSHKTRTQSKTICWNRNQISSSKLSHSMIGKWRSRKKALRKWFKKRMR